MRSRKTIQDITIGPSCTNNISILLTNKIRSKNGQKDHFQTTYMRLKVTPCVRDKKYKKYCGVDARRGVIGRHQRNAPRPLGTCAGVEIQITGEITTIQLVFVFHKFDVL